VTYQNFLWKSVKPTLCSGGTVFPVDHSKDLFSPETGSLKQFGVLNKLALE